MANTITDSIQPDMTEDDSKDYSNTAIYIIYCVDDIINDIYVGSNTRFNMRVFYYDQQALPKQGLPHPRNRLQRRR